MDHFFRENALLDGCFDLLHGGLHVFREQQHVVACCQRLDISIPGSFSLGDTFHIHGVRETKTVEVQFLA